MFKYRLDLAQEEELTGHGYDGFNEYPTHIFLAKSDKNAIKASLKYVKRLNKNHVSGRGLLPYRIIRLFRIIQEERLKEISVKNI